MAVKVVDASALAALLFGEPEGVAVAALLHDASLVAPALMRFEMANICLKKIRRHPAQRVQANPAGSKHHVTRRKNSESIGALMFGAGGLYGHVGSVGRSGGIS